MTGGAHMTTKEVMFDSVEDVKRFVQQSEKQPEDIDCAAAAAWWTESPYWEFSAWGFIKN